VVIGGLDMSTHLICILETRDPVFYILVTQPYLCDSRDLWRPG
jgi:hypothetical protein